MITGSAARNPEELGPGFLNIHKTLMCLYSALHQEMSAIYIMLPLRSVTAFLSFSLTPSSSIFRHDFSPQKVPELCLFLSASLSASPWMLALSTNNVEWRLKKNRSAGITSGWMGKVVFPLPVQNWDITDKGDWCIIWPLKRLVH